MKGKLILWQVGELETQIDIFEAEIEGLSIKKGKTKPPRLVRQSGKLFIWTECFACLVIFG